VTLQDLKMSPQEAAHYLRESLDSRAAYNQPFGDYTPSEFLSYGDLRARHRLRATVAASVADCVTLLQDWKRLPLCFDLIDTVCA
jgi:hypothetical protein